jgi:hypothetical protein
MPMPATAGQSKPATVSCPAEHLGRPLEHAAIFAGPPAKMARIVPRVGGYQLDAQYWGPDGFHLVCTYRATKETITIPLPRHIRACLFTEDWNLHCGGAAMPPD